MKFGGLFDCAPTKVHGVGLLIYDNVKPEIVSFTIKRQYFCKWTNANPMKFFSRALTASNCF